MSWKNKVDFYCHDVAEMLLCSSVTLINSSMGRVCHNIVCIDIIQYFLGLLGKVTFVWIKKW